MKMTGEYAISAPRQEVWQALNDTEVLKHCIPGCDEIVKRSDTEFDAKVTAKVGPVKARFAGRVHLSNLDPPNGYTISGEGISGAAGFAKGSADIKLEEQQDGGTMLRYEVAATVGGKLAQVGGRLIDATANRLADQFFSRFAERLRPEAEAPEKAAVKVTAVVTPAAAKAPAEAAAAAPATATRGGLRTVLWVVGILVVVIILVLVFGS